MGLDGRIDQVREMLLAKPGATEDFPFGPDVMVFRIGEKGKIFGFLAWEENPLRISLKCDPDRALELRDRYPDIIPGYHLNKRLWNTVILGADEVWELLPEMIDESYDLILASLPKSKRP